MGWVAERRSGDGRSRFTAMYRDPYGRTRSAGTFGRERDAIRATQRRDDDADQGTWIDPAAGRNTSKEYAQEVRQHSRHLEVTKRAG